MPFLSPRGIVAVALTVRVLLSHARRAILFVPVLLLILLQATHKSLRCSLYWDCAFSLSPTAFH